MTTTTTTCSSFRYNASRHHGTGRRVQLQGCLDKQVDWKTGRAERWGWSRHGKHGNLDSQRRRGPLSSRCAAHDTFWLTAADIVHDLDG